MERTVELKNSRGWAGREAMTPLHSSLLFAKGCPSVSMSYPPVHYSATKPRQMMDTLLSTMPETGVMRSSGVSTKAASLIDFWVLTCINGSEWAQCVETPPPLLALLGTQWWCALRHLLLLPSLYTCLLRNCNYIQGYTVFNQFSFFLKLCENSSPLN